MLAFLLIAAVMIYLTMPTTTGGGGGTSYGGGGYEGSGYGSGYEGDVSGTDQDILARTIYGEARNQGMAGMQAVANVIMNRARDTAHFPEGAVSVAAICQQPNQFSCWNTNDPNRATIEQVTEANPIFRECLQIAARALAGQLPDNTGGAEFYYAPAGMLPAGRVPNWASSMVRTASIGDQIFYRYPSGMA